MIGKEKEKRREREHEPGGLFLELSKYKKIPVSFSVSKPVLMERRN